MKMSRSHLTLLFLTVSLIGCSQQATRVPVCPLDDQLPAPDGSYRTYESVENVGQVPVPEGWSVVENLPQENRISLQSNSGITLQFDLECCSTPPNLRLASYSFNASGRPVWLEAGQQGGKTIRGFLFPTAFVDPEELAKENIVLRSPPQLQFGAVCGDLARDTCRDSVIRIVRGLRFDSSATAKSVNSAVSTVPARSADRWEESQAEPGFTPPSSGSDQIFTPSLC